MVHGLTLLGLTFISTSEHFISFGSKTSLRQSTGCVFQRQNTASIILLSSILLRILGENLRENAGLLSRADLEGG
jgi:hypothetical protein